MGKVIWLIQLTVLCCKCRKAIWRYHGPVPKRSKPVRPAYFFPLSEGQSKPDTIIRCPYCGKRPLRKVRGGVLKMLTEELGLVP